MKYWRQALHSAVSAEPSAASELRCAQLMEDVARLTSQNDDGAAEVGRLEARVAELVAQAALLWIDGRHQCHALLLARRSGPSRSLERWGAVKCSMECIECSMQCSIKCCQMIEYSL